MIVVALSAFAAIAVAAGQVLTKDMVDRLPPRRLIGVLFALNASMVLPAAPFIDWSMTPGVVAIHVFSAVLLAVGTLFTFDLFVHGTASATTAALALSPIPAAVMAVPLGLERLSPVQFIACAVVLTGVLVALPAAFSAMNRVRAVVAVVGVAVTGAAITVVSRVLADRGVSTVEIYLVRTSICAFAFMAVLPPRGIPVRTTPLLALRAAFITTQFVLVIEAVRRGSPVIVQTLVATAPLVALTMEMARRRSWSASPRVVVSSLLVVVGVVVVALVG